MRALPVDRGDPETPFDPPGPELSAAIERRLGQRTLGEVSFLVHHGEAEAGA